MKKYDFLIVGAGLFGSVIGNLLSATGYSCLVIDKRNHVAGNIFTEKKDNIDIHKYGAHIFHTDNDIVWNYINKFSTFTNYIHCPIANYHNEIYNLPFNMNTFVKMWSDVISPQDAKRRIEQQRSAFNGNIPRNLEEQAISLVGVDIYNKLIKEYTEKQWQDRCTNLSADIIKRLPVRFTFNNNYFNDKYQGIPKNGYTDIIYKLLHDCDIKLDTNFFDYKNELTRCCKYVIYTGRLDELFGYNLGKLEYRSLRFITKKLNIDNFQGTSVVNYTDSNVPYTRIIEHKHFTNCNSPITYITYEYPTSYTIDSEPYYPINNNKNVSLYNLYAQQLKKYKNIYIGGRLAEYKYMDMDDTILSAINLYKKIKEDISNENINN